MKKRVILIYSLITLFFATFAYATPMVRPNPYKKPDQAFKYVYDLSVTQNTADPWANYLLGKYYTEGYGVKQNTMQAYIWYKMSTDHNYQPAIVALKELKAGMTTSQIANAEKQDTDLRNKQVSKFLKSMQHMNG